MIHSRNNENLTVTIYVQPSRFKKILSDIRSLNGLYVENFIENVCKEFNYFSFYSSDIKDNNNNHYTIIKKDYNEVFGKCSECDCNRKRWINSKTGICFYKEDINNNYTTKIPKL